MAEASFGVRSCFGVAASRAKVFWIAVTGNGGKAHKWVLRVIGLMLLGAAGLKGHQVATSHLAADGWLGSRTLSVALVEFELALGGLLLFGPWARFTWAVTFTTFAAFAGVSLAMLAGGSSSCGCFGVIAVQPVYPLVLDMAVLMLLAWARPVAYRADPTSKPRSRLAFSAVILLVAFAGAVPVLALGAPMMGADGIAFTEGRVAIVDTAKWQHSDFPLMRYVKGGDALADGAWTIILYRPRCPACRDLLAKWQLTGNESGSFRKRLALIEVPGASVSMENTLPSISRAVRLRLDPSYKWDIRVPLEINLDDGVVLSIGP